MVGLARTYLAQGRDDAAERLYRWFAGSKLFEKASG